LRIQQLFLDHRERLHVLPRFSSFFLPLFVDLLGTLVLQMLHSRYPRWFRSGWGVPTDQAVLRLVQRLCDPQSGDKERSSSITIDGTDAPEELGRRQGGLHDTAAPTAAAAAGSPHSLFFHTSSLIRSAVPLPSAAEARLVRKDESSSSAREWRNAAAVAAVRAGAGAITARAAASATAPLNQTILNSARGDVRIGSGVRDSNPFSLSARFAAAEAQRQAEVLRRQRLPTLRAAHARATAAQAVAARAAAASSSSSQLRRPATSSRVADPYAVPSVLSAAPGALAAESGSSSPRRALFELGLRKVAHRHARDNVYARALIAQMPGLVTTGIGSAAVAANPASPRRAR
jgi:hypothetical protein